MSMVGTPRWRFISPGSPDRGGAGRTTFVHLLEEFTPTVVSRDAETPGLSWPELDALIPLYGGRSQLAASDTSVKRARRIAPNWLLSCSCPPLPGQRD